MSKVVKVTPIVVKEPMVSIKKQYTKDAADKLREKAVTIVVGTVRQMIELGKVLSEIAWGGIGEKPLFAAWGYKTIEEYVEQELGYKPRSGFYYLNTYRELDAGRVQEKDIIELGAFKGMHLAALTKRRVVTPANYDKWVKTLKDSTQEQAVRTIKAANEKAATQAKDEEQQPIHPIPETGRSFHLYFSGDQLTSVENALTKAELVCKDAGKPSEKNNHLFECVCNSYNALNIGKQDTFVMMLGNIELNFGLVILAQDAKTGKLVYGEHHAHELMKE